MRYRKLLLVYVLCAGSVFFFGIHVLSVALQHLSITGNNMALRHHNTRVVESTDAAVEKYGTPTNAVETLENVTEGGNVYTELEKRHPSAILKGYTYHKHCPDGGSFESPVEIVQDAVYVYSTFYDNRTSPAKLRFIAMVHKDFDKRLWCHFQHDSLINHSAVVEFYEMCENRKLPFGGWILSCLVPEILEEVPCRVMMSGSSWSLSFTNLPVLRVMAISQTPHNKPDTYDTRNATSKPNIAVCVPPVHSNLAVTKIIEFLEFAILLGARNVFLYVITDNKDLLKTIHYYERKGVVIVIPWKLPFGQRVNEETYKLQQKLGIKPMSVWYHGQSVAINDCLYRTMSHFDVTLFCDFDEFLIPGGNITDWPELLSTIQQPEISGYSFKSAYFSIPIKNSARYGVMSSVRSAEVSKLRNKVAVYPSRVFEIGIHHVSRTVLTPSKYAPIVISPKIALLHHVRKCINEKRLDCLDTVIDRTVQTKYQVLEGNIIRVISHLGITTS